MQLSSWLKKYAVSKAAVSGASEPCVVFRSMEMPNSLRRVPGTAFAVEGGFRNTMRLNFSNVQPELIPVAVERLAAVIQARLRR